ncbi:MAG: NADH-quinone oxidoreductase subunit N [Opitutales bacterium]
MTPEAYQQLAATNEWMALWPEIAVALLGALILGLDLVSSPRTRDRVLPGLAMVGFLAIFAGVVLTSNAALAEPDRLLFGGMIAQTDFSQWMRIFFLIGAIGAAYLGLAYLRKQDLPRSEFFTLLCFATASMMLLAQSAHFVMLFVSLEALTITFYVLVAYCRYSPFSLEAGLKYVVLGAFSSAILLFGIVLLYGTAGNPLLEGATGDGLGFRALRGFLATGGNADYPLAVAGVALVVCGLAFKISAVPFHIWSPDVYHGAPTPVAAFLAVGSKAAGFAVLVNLMMGPFAPMSEITVPLLSAIMVLTVLYGNFAALGEGQLKRLMALSGIAHAGYLLLGVTAVAAGLVEAWLAVFFYLVTYLFGSYSVFGVLTFASGVRDEQQEITSYRRFSRQQPFLSVVLVIGLASLAGIPPLAGFVGKLLLFVVAFQAGLIVPLVAAIVGVVASIYYYFGWMRLCIFADDTAADPEPVQPRIRLSLDQKFAIGIMSGALLVLGVYQGTLLGG